jgi:5,10-methylenetetrahydrofolate reductase
VSESSLQTKLEAGKFVVTGEMGPPKSASRELVLKKAQWMKGFDGVNITDNQMAVGHMSPLAVSAITLQEGLAPIPQFTLRDRNRLGLLSDLLGAYALGVRTIFCLTGDHPRFGNHPDAKPVYEFTIIEFLKKVTALCECGEYFNGQPIKTPPGVIPKFFIGAAANPMTKGGLDENIGRLEKKCEAGARFFQTQPVFDIEGFKRWMEAVCKSGLHKRAYFLIGAMPVKSVKAITHLANDVPGTCVPQGIIQRMEKAADPAEEGKKICVETLNVLKATEGVSGIHLMSVYWEEALPQVAEAAGLLRHSRGSGNPE